VSSLGFVSTDINMAAVLMVVNIENDRYHPAMAKSNDPDIQLLAALADPTRMEILRELAGAPEVCACDFTSCCDVSQPTVSHHLKVLRDAGAVTSERRGNWVFYSIAPNLMDRLGGIAQSLAPGGLIPASSLRRRAPNPRIAAAARTTPVSPGAAAPS
jgi:ArsR family transcriptional regulator